MPLAFNIFRYLSSATKNGKMSIDYLKTSLVWSQYCPLLRLTFVRSAARTNGTNKSNYKSIRFSIWGSMIPSPTIKSPFSTIRNLMVKKSITKRFNKSYPSLLLVYRWNNSAWVSCFRKWTSKRNRLKKTIMPPPHQINIFIFPTSPCLDQSFSMLGEIRVLLKHLRTLAFKLRLGI